MELSIIIDDRLRSVLTGSEAGARGAVVLLAVGVATTGGDFELDPVSLRANFRNGDTERESALAVLALRDFLPEIDPELLGGVR